jgi:hypothetical protein
MATHSKIYQAGGYCGTHGPFTTLHCPVCFPLETDPGSEPLVAYDVNGNEVPFSDTRAATVFIDDYRSLERRLREAEERVTALKVEREMLYDSIKAAERAAGNAQGMVMVPREPTPEMLTAGAEHLYEDMGMSDLFYIWKAMISAAPQEGK